MVLTDYLLSLVGIVILSIIIDLILPSGQVNKYIKSIFSFIFIFVLVSPIPKLLNGEFNFNNIFQSSSTELNENYLNNLKQEQADKLMESLNKQFEERGFYGLDILVTYNSDNLIFEIQKIFVDLTNLVLNENNQHINKYTTIKDLLIEFTGVREEQIILNGWKKIF